MPGYDDFIKDVSPAQYEYAQQINGLLTGKGYVVKVDTAKNGYTVSYCDKKSKKVIMNFVFRKSGLQVRIYGDFSGHYIASVESLPESMKKAIIKSSDCKRLFDPTKCNSRCSMGNVFTLDGVECKKCRYSCFFFIVNEENTPFIITLLENEINFRESKA